MTIKTIIHKYKDALLDSRRMGGDECIKRATDAKKSFRDAVHVAATNGLSEDESYLLLSATLHISKEDFLFALKETPNFFAIRRAINDAQVRMNNFKNTLKTNEGKVQYLCELVISERARPLLKKDLLQYKKMADVMSKRLEKTQLLERRDSKAIVLEVIEDFENCKNEFNFFHNLTTMTPMLSMALQYIEAYKSILVGLAIATIAISVSLTCGLSLMPSITIAAGAGLVSGGATFFAQSRTPEDDKKLDDSIFRARLHG